MGCDKQIFRSPTLWDMVKYLMFFSLQLEEVKLPNKRLHHPAWETQVMATCLDSVAAEEGTGFT